MVVGISRHYRIDIDALLLPLQQSFIAAHASHDLRIRGAGRTYSSRVASTKRVSRWRPSSSRNMRRSFGRVVIALLYYEILFTSRDQISEVGSFFNELYGSRIRIMTITMIYVDIRNLYSTIGELTIVWPCSPNWSPANQSSNSRY